MANTIRAVEIRNGNARPVEIALGGADPSYVNTREPVVLVSVGKGNTWPQELALESDAAWDLAAAIISLLGQQVPERKAA